MDHPEYKTCLNTALRILGKRDHSSCELERKLKQRGYQYADIQKTLAECRHFSYLDDRRYTFSQIRYLRSKGHGAYRIRYTLKNKGLPPDLIAEAVEAECNEINQINDCRHTLTKKMKQSGQGALISSNDQKRLYRFLIQRGYASTIIRRVMDEKTDLAE